RRLDRIHRLLVLPRVDEGAVDYFLTGKYIGDLREDVAAASRDYTREDGGNAEGLGGLGQAGRVIDDCLRIVTVQVCELKRLMVDQNQYRIFWAKKRSKTVTKHLEYILC